MSYHQHSVRTQQTQPIPDTDAVLWTMGHDLECAHQALADAHALGTPAEVAHWREQVARIERCIARERRARGEEVAA